MALPWFESLDVWGATASAARDAAPKRFAALFMGCGINGDHWWAKGSGRSMELGKSLQSLDPLKDKLNFITGLFNPSAVGVGIHPGQTGNILSGAPLQKGSVLQGGISMDQALAQRFQDRTVTPSLVLGCEEPTTGYHETNFSMAYSSHISWRNASSPMPLELYPALAFDSLFGNQGATIRSSVLDRVRSQAEALSQRLGQADKMKLDEYLTSVREIEIRVARLREQAERASTGGAETVELDDAMRRPSPGLPDDIRDHMRLMLDIIALAFQTDKTRVATLLLNRDLSGMFYPFLNVRTTHHSASHRDTSDDYERISSFYCEQLAYLAKKLDAMPEGEGTVLDHSALMFISSMWSGSRHDSSKVPLLLVGGLSGALETGRVLDYGEMADENRKLCSLYLALMDKMGERFESFGDSDIRLAGI